MTTKTSVAGLARGAQREEKRALAEIAAAARKSGVKDGGGVSTVATHDSFVNFKQKMGLGADNALSSGDYRSVNHFAVQCDHPGFIGQSLCISQQNLTSFLHFGSRRCIYPVYQSYLVRMNYRFAVKAQLLTHGCFC